MPLLPFASAVTLVAYTFGGPGVAPYVRPAPPDSTMAAQTPPLTIASATTPADCHKAASKTMNDGYKAIFSAGLSDSAVKVRSQAVTKQFKADMTVCADKFNPAQLDAQGLRDLIKLLTESRVAELKARVPNVVERAVALASTPYDKGKLLLEGLGLYAHYESKPDELVKAEAYAARIDSLSGIPAIQTAAHAALLDAYIETDAPYVRHIALAQAAADQTLNAFATLPADQRKAAASAVADAYGYVAESRALAWQPDSAITLLQHAIAALGDTTLSAVKSLRKSAFYYGMIGKPAPTINAEYWINAPSGAHAVPFNAAALTLVEFTSTGCGWCRVGYPAIRSLQRRYTAQGFQPMLVAQIEGDVNGKTAPAEQEVAYDKEHWVVQDTIAFPIALAEMKVIPATKGDSSAAKTPRRTPSAAFDAYHVTGYPLFVFIDRAGIVRFVQYGHSANLEDRFARVIEKTMKPMGATNVAAGIPASR